MAAANSYRWVTNHPAANASKIQLIGRSATNSIEQLVLVVENTLTLPLSIICFSHLRWNFVYQRPQHLMGRCQLHADVFFFEEPLQEEGVNPSLSIRRESNGVHVLTPVLPLGATQTQAVEAQRCLLQDFLKQHKIERFIAWYYTPMALKFTLDFQPVLAIYDCMDELSAFQGAPPELVALERALFRRVAAVFVGGQSLYHVKRNQHNNVHLFSSSIDRAHFASARGLTRERTDDPPDQLAIPHPRIGFFGVLDERLDQELLETLASNHPHWNFVLIGPVVKISSDELPKLPNIHYLGQKQYADLPQYLMGWDVAMLPFALNESTRFISPTKTPEYLAAGKPVVSTPIRDVIEPYGRLGVVSIGATPEAFGAAIERSLKVPEQGWWEKVDELLNHTSWDRTFAGMWSEISRLVRTAESKKSGPVRGRRTLRVFDYLIVGAGFAGSVIAERLASQLDASVLIIDRRPHIGGNAYDFYNDAGILVHRYGPHIFHTNSKKVFDYLSRFTAWRPYEHRVQASVDGQLVPIPINMDTLNKLYGLNLTSSQVEDFLGSLAEPRKPIVTSEDVVVSRVGRELYEKFFRNYTRKQWDLDPSELDASVTARVPVRASRDDRYFTDRYQAMPLHGYTKMFDRILSHPNIRIMLNANFLDVQEEVSFREVIFTGRIDEYFDYCLGKLPYRSLRFEHQTHDCKTFQAAAVVNYPNEHAYTRVTEFKYLTGQEHSKTSIVYEYPCSEGDPYYPVPQPQNAELYRQYKAMADLVPNVHFIGRLGTYKYYNMDQVVAQALKLFQTVSEATNRLTVLNEETGAILLADDSVGLRTGSNGNSIVPESGGDKAA
jgi:UDP-galactopyranose mutase